jgi:hypothetical protein
VRSRRSAVAPARNDNVSSREMSVGEMSSTARDGEGGAALDSRGLQELSGLIEWPRIALI